jgi:hypothetical protein
MRFFPACIAALSLALVACDSHDQSQKTASSSQATPVESTSTSASGTIAVWVPAGVVGSDYWIYLNRRIVNAPPHSTENLNPGNFVLVRTQNGFEIVNADGLQLRAVDDSWDTNVEAYVASHPADGPHVFQEVDLTVQPGSYTLDAAYLSNTGDEFPFVFTRGQTIAVTAGQTTKVYLAIPNGWSDRHAFAAQAAFCPAKATAPDFEGLKSTVDRYMSDPLVKAVRDASAAARTGSAHSVVLNLAPEQGGQREFDGVELSHIIDGIQADHYFPSDEDVASCQNYYPEYASSYASYRQTLAVINNDMASLRRFADGLGKD